MPDGTDIFVTTRWTSVLAAGRSPDTTRARTALADLCRTYWYPLYAYVRRRGHSPHDAEDLTQGFFSRLLRLNSLSGVSPQRGKFRAFLLSSINHYLADEWQRSTAQKRDVRRTIPLDAQEAETRYRQAPADHLTPERLFDRQWALTLLETVVGRLRQEYEASGRGALFDELRFAITCDSSDARHADTAARLSMSEEAVRVAVHRLRQRYRKLLRDEIAQTVSGECDLAEELAELRRILAGGV